MQAVDFARFEEDFKLGINRAKPDTVDAASPNANSNRKMSKKPELLSLMDANRNRNASIGRHTLEMHWKHLFLVSSAQTVGR